MSPWLTDAMSVAGRRAQSRVLFGPHETNLCVDRSFGERSVAYYERRARGGAGIIVTENASVHPSDHPYERAPLATACAEGWSATVRAARAHGTLVLAGLTHNGLQGSSAFTQGALWGPSRVADVATRELPMEMEPGQIDAVVNGFRSAARLAADADMDGVEIDIGPTSLLRQFHSRLTNNRDDAYGEDPTLLTRRVLAAVRNELGRNRILAVRLCCDELAPWAGITPKLAAFDARAIATMLDLLVVVRGGPYSTAAYRPDAHTEPAFNVDLCREIRATIADAVPVALQGSVIDIDTAQWVLDTGVADVVEMTRAQIAEPDLVAKARLGRSPRPCLLCNQACLVRDNRNPIVSCVVNPTAGHETVDLIEGDADGSGPALVVGGGVAGLEAARVLAGRGFAVTVVERSPDTGGMLRHCAVGPGRTRLRQLPRWLAAECARLGVSVRRGETADADEVAAARLGGAVVVIATGSVAAPPGIATDASATVLTPPEVFDGAEVSGPVLVFDPVGGPVGVGVAEMLRSDCHEVAIVTPDLVVGKQLDRTGDLAASNVRLQQAGIVRHRASVVRSVIDRSALLENTFTGVTTSIPCAVLIDCTHRLPDRSVQIPGGVRVGDCVAPRTALEAVREGRSAALHAMMELDSATTGSKG
ncbi:mycofactocin system FadH/OYE family oxidoreductase 1 [Antrihabitans cavernicola]|uniref:Mycofactocin system FadH/OYE family oxidoreductase 1 n=1 Tax=Antrihabitans cavernicola TaxID=2495913 RepID=A0A5A7S2J2_9NOCA|nr:mycofactocin system FadH/OYE family oxidoreductase 1 [Spelaeibacter cavernicola]KAA0018381.1 mycofactocin system FadH/OYE family oxidoreductase 1 [Spelaeibacter cavernicola]